MVAHVAFLAADRTGTPLSNLVPWLILLVGLTIAGGIAILLVRRWLRDADASASAGFTLQDLREMHASGEISDLEYERARGAMIGRLKSPVNDPNSDPPTNNQPPNMQ